MILFLLFLHDSPPSLLIQPLTSYQMKHFFIFVLSITIFLTSSLSAESLQQEASQSIGIIDFVIKNSKYEKSECDIHSCQMQSTDGGVILSLNLATINQNIKEDLHYLLKINVKGTLFSTKVEVYYRNDPTKETMKTGNRSDDIDKSYKNEHEVLRSWVKFIKDSTR